MCPTGTLITNEPDQALFQLRDSFLPAADFQQLHEQLLVTRPAMRAEHFAEGYTAVNVNLNLEGVMYLLCPS